jgi:3',5'-cyclic AMP phosphodiesterase CpdA
MKWVRWIFLIVSAWGLCATAQAAPTYFVQISDTHLGRGGTDATRAAIASINTLPMPIACVVHTGDIVGDTLADPQAVAHAKRLLASLTPPLICVPGNHDILKDNIPQTHQAYTNAFGPLIQSHQFGSLRFIALYTEPLARNIRISGYNPIRALEQELRKAPQSDTIVCHHTPSVSDFYNNRAHPGWPASQAAAWRALLNRFSVKAVLCGHFHRNEQHWVGNVPVHVGPAIADYWQRTPSYRLYAYEHGRLSYHTIYLPASETH